MNIFRAILLPLYQAPDTPVEPVIDLPLDPATIAAAGDPPAPDPQPDPAAPPAGDPDPKPDGRKNPWYLKRIADEAEARRQAEQRATDAEALAARLQAAGKDPAAADPKTPAQQPRDFDAAVRTETQRLRMQDDSAAVRDAGLKEFGTDFNQTLGILTAIGATNDDMVLDLLAVDKANAHKILANLAKDPEKAASLVGMDSRRRIAELTRMADAIAPAAKPVPADPKAPVVPPAKQVSKAPAPAPPVDPSASKTVDWRSDAASDAEFSKGWDDNIAKRANTRR
jgi:hypothetical protein